MALTSGTTHAFETRDTIIQRALRIIGTYGTGETPEAAKVTEAAQALNDLVKELNADGMPLWKIKTYQMALTAAKSVYTIGTAPVSGTAPDITQVAPLRITEAWTIRNNLSSNINIITRDKYNTYGDKTTQGDPTQIWYNPPGALFSSTGAGEQIGTITVYQTPGADQATNVTLNFMGQTSFEDFNISTDQPDFPTYWNNAITWLLAADLAYEDGLPFAERSMIEKKAAVKKLTALGFGTEEGSLYFQPAQMWGPR